MSILSLVVARQGSKGLKNKVIRKINNKYVFEYSIEYSLELSNKIDGEIFTVVSSDSEVIEKYCLDRGILFIKRIPELASDTARIDDVIYDACIKVNREFKYISLLYGNIPIRYPDEFLKTFDFLERNSDYDAVLSMQNVEKYNPAWMFELNEDILPAKKEEGFRRQDLKQYMFHDGHTILTRSSYFIEFMKRRNTRKILCEAFGRKIKPMLNNKLVIDIDTEKDLKLAEAIITSSKEAKPVRMPRETRAF